MQANSTDSAEIETIGNTPNDENQLHPSVVLLLEIGGTSSDVKSLIEKIGGQILIEVKQPRALIVRVRHGQRKILESLPNVNVHNVTIRQRPILRIKLLKDNKTMKAKYVVRDNQIIRVERNQQLPAANNQRKKR